MLTRMYKSAFAFYTTLTRSLKVIMFYRTIALALGVSVAGCATIEVPKGQESNREFVQETVLPYKDAYQIIAKQMRACYRVIGLLGNGYDVQADLDSAERIGRVELYYVGLTGASKPEDSIFSRTVTVKARNNGSMVVTTGTTPKYVYLTHLSVKSWLSGSDSCGPGNQAK
jgi:hypothetical protein